MAPISRTASHGSGGGVAKKPQRKRPVRKEPSDGWDFSLVESSNIRTRTNGSTKDVPEQESAPVVDSINSPTDVDAAVAPLREMAERVGKEVETFAETLDDFFTNELPTVENRFNAVFDLVLKFRSIANDVVEQLKSRHERELRQQLRQEWSEQARVSTSSTASRSLSTTKAAPSAALSARKAEQVRELRAWQQEADIWDLFRIMLELHPFEEDAHARQQEREELLAKLGPPHRYMSEGDLWERFLNEDSLAKERHLIKEWLEKTAYHQQSDLQGIVEELEAKAGRGKGLWSSGWLHTRERIKGEKRMRTWPNAAESPLPQIRCSDNNQLLVTTLDPDAPLRQKRALERPDSYFERAMWIACWEMLRRGMSWQDICDWCDERKEGWRAVSLGAAVDRTDALESTAAFRAVCQRAAQSGSLTEYQAAVLGVLGGDVRSVDTVCRTVDDHLYAYYNGMLLKQFDDYLSHACPEKAAPEQWKTEKSENALHDAAHAEEAIQNLILRLRKAPGTSSESTQPMKIIQSYLLADEVGSLVHTVGAAIAETAALQGPEDVIFLRDHEAQEGTTEIPEREVALDPQTLRIAAHMAIVHRALSPDYLEQLEGDELMEDENVLVAYIQALRVAGKRDLIPTYASKLQRERYVIVLGRLLQDITDSQEQSRMLRLLGEYELDVTAILTEQLRWVFVHSLRGSGIVPPLRILELTADTKLHPGQQIIVGFLPEEVSAEDDAMVSCLRWFQHMEGGWKLMFEALSVALRKCLINGRIACARMIVDTFPYNEVSLRKSYETIGRAINVMNTKAEPQDQEEAMKREVMQRQSNTYYELSRLVDAIEALAVWRNEEQKYITRVTKPPNVPDRLKDAFKAVKEAMAPILRGILQRSVDLGEEEDLAFIRNHYIPEIVVAYNTVLHAAGNLITRDYLLESMQLSVTIADGTRNGESNGLQEAFVKAGRMRELVESFALTSKVMLILKAEGKPWKQGKDSKGADLGVWEIGGRGGGEE